MGFSKINIERKKQTPIRKYENKQYKTARSHQQHLKSIIVHYIYRRPQFRTEIRTRIKNVGVID